MFFRVGMEGKTNFLDAQLFFTPFFLYFPKSLFTLPFKVLWSFRFDLLEESFASSANISLSHSIHARWSHFFAVIENDNNKHYKVVT